MLTAPRTGWSTAAAQGGDGVVGVEQLHARVEAEHGGDDRGAQQAVDRRVEAAPDDRLQAQHGARDRGVAAGEGADEPLELADVALEARAQRKRSASSSVKKAGAPGSEP